MSEVSTAGLAEPSPAPAAVEPSAPQTPTAQPAPSTDDMAQQLTAAGFEGNLSGALEAAKGYQSAKRSGVLERYQKVASEAERLGVGNVDELISQMANMSPQAAAEVAETVQPEALASDTPPITMDGITQMFTDQIMEMRNQERTDYASQQAELATQQKEAAENAFYRETLTQGKFEVPESGNLPLRTLGSAAILQQCLQDAKVSHLDEYATPGERASALAAHPSQAQLDAAKTEFVNCLKTDNLRVVDNYAEAQDTIPTSVPPGTPSGGTESPQQRVDILHAPQSDRTALAQRVLDRLGIKPDDFAEEVAQSRT